MEHSRIAGKNRTWPYHLFAIFSVTVWGLSFISTRVLLDNGLNPIEIYIYRFIIAYLVMLALNHRKLWANSLKDEALFVVCGLVAGSIYFISENVALEYTLVSNVSLITSLSPLLTVLIVGLVYKTNRPGNGAYIGSLVAFIGVGLVIFNSSFNMAINPIGDLLSLLAAFCWAIYSLLLKPLNAHYDARFITRKVFFYGVLTALPFLLVEPEMADPHILLSPVVIGNLLFLSLICSFSAYLLWAFSVAKIGAVSAANYLYFQPLITMVFSVVILHEALTAVGLMGCVMILAGVWLADFLQNKNIFRKP
ncbi:MAG: DMT family transporter [Duncaniella sp.]|nr:DMT family transporter [Duncaniella sp.]MDE5752910.1 DMT family transporter [Duncaniella sp.]MDE6328120.1 DMT family transporter [Duncaniella sp.]MDE6466218.1 DMT family transporter [Duncaniella sp.]